MNIDQICELLRLLREINERLSRIEGIVQNAAMSPAGQLLFGEMRTSYYRFLASTANEG